MAVAGGAADFKAECGLDRASDTFKCVSIRPRGRCLSLSLTCSLCGSYLKQGGVSTTPELDDAGEWSAMFEAMAGVGIPDSERDALLRIVAAVTVLGEITFDGPEKAAVTNIATLNTLAKLFGVDSAQLGIALTTNTIVANTETVTNTLDLRQATYARDALAKAIYDRAFTWLVGRLNSALAECGKDAVNARSTVMGLLDIYGFEILASNGFEQVCINYCNEKLQQVFIELTLKSEQEEYKREGIEWVPVEYFNNAIICNLIDSIQEPHGLIPLLDDCCLGPGDMTDADFHAVLDKAMLSFLIRNLQFC